MIYRNYWPSRKVISYQTRTPECKQWQIVSFYLCPREETRAGHCFLFLIDSEIHKTQQIICPIFIQHIPLLGCCVTWFCDYKRENLPWFIPVARGCMFMFDNSSRFMAVRLLAVIYSDRYTNKARLKSTNGLFPDYSHRGQEFRLLIDIRQ